MWTAGWRTEEDEVVPPRPSLRARLVPSILQRLGSVGLKMELFFVVREGIDQSCDAPIDPRYTFRFLTVADLDELRRLEPEEDISGQMIGWLEAGKLCFGVLDDERLIAVMWCDLETFNHPPAFRRLSPSEVYLFAAYVEPDYRGKGIAPQMRTACYSALRKMGRTDFLSYTEHQNTSAQRFKEKLGAQNDSLRLHIDLFGKLRRTFTLRTFR